MEQNINNICDNLKKQWRDNLRFFSNTVQSLQKDIDEKDKEIQNKDFVIQNQKRIIDNLISQKDGYIIKHRNGVWCFHPVSEFKIRRNKLNLEISEVIKECNLNISEETFENCENGLILFKDIYVKVKFDSQIAIILHNFYKNMEKIE